VDGPAYSTAWLALPRQARGAGEINTNQAKSIQTKQNQYKPSKINTNQAKSIQTKKNQYKPSKINTNQAKSIQTKQKLL